ncbi:MAG: DUF2062 domain-containing protein [Kiloniellales bacterium]
MVFRRRNPVPLSRRLRELIWPRAGWGRTSTYFAHRLRRLPGTPGWIAAGFASGAAISMTPFYGLHFLLSVLLALLVRGSLVASALGTVIGNPWTIPPIAAWNFWLGHRMLGGNTWIGLPEHISFQYIIGNLWTIMTDHFWEIFWPIMVGSIPTAIVAWFAFYFPLRSLVASYQRARRWRIGRAAKRRAEKAARDAEVRQAEAQARQAQAESKANEGPVERKTEDGKVLETMEQQRQ